MVPVSSDVREISLMEKEESHAPSDHELSKHLESLKKRIDGNRRQKEALMDSRLVGRRNPVMYKVPDVLRRQKEHAYSPTTVSIGPLHKGKEGLQAMEQVKLSYMCCLFERTENFENTQRDCLAAMLKEEELVRICYEEAKLSESGKPASMSHESNTTEDVSLAEMILIDGCFIIELVYKNYLKDYDPILWNPFNYYAVQRDLLLLENQIPFFVLEDLFSMTVGRIKTNSNRRSLARCLLSFFADMMGIENGEIEQNGQIEQKYYKITPYHILHFLHIHFLPTADDESIESKFNYREPPKFKYSATELRLAGVKLEAGKNRNYFNMKFSADYSCFCLCRRGRLEVPPFTIYESTEPFLRNLIAFEQCCPWIESYFTSHAFLMDILIDNEEDVKLLEEAGIICNYSGSNEAVSQFFNGICKNAIPRCFLYGEQYKQVMDFCKPWRVSIGKLKRDYFGNPWSGISVIAAIILFTLAFLQTLYAMLSYY